MKNGGNDEPRNVVPAVLSAPFAVALAITASDEYETLRRFYRKVHPRLSSTHPLLPSCPTVVRTSRVAKTNRYGLLLYNAPASFAQLLTELLRFTRWRRLCHCCAILGTPGRTRLLVGYFR